MLLVLSLRVFVFLSFTFGRYCQPTSSEVPIFYGREKPLI